MLYENDTFDNEESKLSAQHIRSLPDDVLLIVARDIDHITPKFREVYAFVDSIGDRTRHVNADWVSGRALESAYYRGLIDTVEFDYLWEKTS